MGSSGEEERNFRFNDIEFSDRVLCLEITPDFDFPSNTSEVSETSAFGATDLKLKKIHINSLMLAYKSRFFHKLFKNGMKETQQRDEVALKIDESEEAAFMDLLKFIYDHSVNASSATDLVDVLMAADKFEVPSCVKYCVEALHKLPMSTELAVIYLELFLSVSSDELLTLIESAQSYICPHFRDLKKSEDEAMSLSHCAVELLIRSDGLEVDSEDNVFDFLLKWSRLYYPELEERQYILTSLLLNFVCLPKMSSLKLKEVIDSSDFDSEKVYKPVLDALFCKDQDVTTPTTRCEYPKRVYNHRVIVNVVQLQLTLPQCVVYFDLTKKECADLVPLKRLYSQTFCFGAQKLLFFAQCNQEKGPIGLYVYVMEGSESCTLDLDISVMNKSSKKFTSLVKAGKSVFRKEVGRGYEDLFSTPWAELMSDESDYFIDGVLHLRVYLTLLS